MIPRNQSGIFHSINLQRHRCNKVFDLFSLVHFRILETEHAAGINFASEMVHEFEHNDT